MKILKFLGIQPMNNNPITVHQDPKKGGRMTQPVANYPFIRPPLKVPLRVSTGIGLETDEVILE